MTTYTLEFSRYPGKFIKHLWTVKTREWVQEVVNSEIARGKSARCPHLSMYEEFLQLDLSVPLEKAKIWTSKGLLQRFRKRVLKHSMFIHLDTQTMSYQTHPCGADLSEYRVRIDRDGKISTVRFDAL